MQKTGLRLLLWAETRSPHGDLLNQFFYFGQQWSMTALGFSIPKLRAVIDRPYNFVR